MAKKSILTEAIAEARQIRETALENAKKQLEESLTPGIKKMLAHKLNEELELDGEIEEETLDESVVAGFEEVKPKKTHVTSVNEAEEDETPEEEEPENADTDEPVEDGEPEAADEEEDATDEPVEDPEASEDGESEEPKTAEEPEEEPAAEEEEAEEIDDDTPLSDIKVSDLKSIIADMIAAGTSTAEPAPEGNEGADMNAADVEIQGTGEEEAPVSGGPQPAGMPAEDPAAAENPVEQQPEEPKEEESDEEIDLSELLKELEEEAGFEANDQRGKGHDKNSSLEGIHQDSETKDSGIQEDKEHGPNCTCDACKEARKAKKDLKKAKEELAEALKTIAVLKDTLNEVNLVNSKLVYMTRTLGNKNLSESQKSIVVHTFDKAASTEEVKEIYRMLQENLKNSTKNVNKKVLAEHRGSASRVIGGATNAVEVDATVKRFQQLAGIVTED